MTNWVRTTMLTHPWMKKVDPSDWPSSHENARWFVPDGKAWPLISIQLYKGLPVGLLNGLIISVSCKDGPKGWIDKSNLPIELIPELIDMMKQKMAP